MKNKNVDNKVAVSSSVPLIGSAACPRCGGDLDIGHALQNIASAGILDFPNADDSIGQTFSYNGEAKLIEVLKCVKCGYSRT